jgi:hypothetical protein
MRFLGTVDPGIEGAEDVVPADGRCSMFCTAKEGETKDPVNQDELLKFVKNTCILCENTYKIFDC